VATVFLGLLYFFQWVHAYALWRRLCDGLYIYWYLRGVITELESWQSVQNFLTRVPTVPRTVEAEIDLKDGIEAAEAQLDALRPDVVLIRYGGHKVGIVPRLIGAERLRGAHLRRILATNLAWPMMMTLVTEGGFNVRRAYTCGAPTMRRLNGLEAQPGWSENREICKENSRNVG
jgi:hypothetical protein